jgi:prolipoprotein diacylglyceryltransferase
MLPILYQNGSFIVYSHDFFTILGLLVGLALYYYELHRRHMLSQQIFWISLAAIFGGGLGCRLILAWEHLPYYTNQADVPFTVLIEQSGKSIIGGIAGGYLGIVLSKKAFKYTLSTGDCYAPAIPLAMAIGRIGCFLAELPLGKPTDLPWGMTVSQSAADQFASCPGCQLKMHPSMLYEIIFHLLAFGIIMRYRHLVVVQGDTLKLYLLAAAIFRFLVEFVRANPIEFWGLTGPQIVLIPLTIPLVVHFVRQWRRGVYKMPAPPVPPGVYTLASVSGSTEAPSTVSVSLSRGEE